jgi:hypothetical protein
MIIKMYFRQSEHNPPHVHAIYGEYIGLIDIQTLEMFEGDLPPKALSLVKEWMSLHKDELLNIWKTQRFIELPPLE